MKHLSVFDANIGVLVGHILNQSWQRQCQIQEDKGEIKIFSDLAGSKSYLRFSKGPKQGFFWDVYGDDFQSVELAIIALSLAPYPGNVSPRTFVIPLSKEEKNA